MRFSAEAASPLSPRPHRQQRLWRPQQRRPAVIEIRSKKPDADGAKAAANLKKSPALLFGAGRTAAQVAPPASFGEGRRSSDPL
jgi:hypothetical protein